MSDIEYSVITSDVIKSFDCTCMSVHTSLHTNDSSSNSFYQSLMKLDHNFMYQNETCQNV